MITDAEVESAVDFLRENAAKAAQARANKVYMEEYRKVVKAQIMRQHGDKPLYAQEALAYSDDLYIAHLAALRVAEEQYEYHRWRMVAAEATINAWQTQSANQRAVKV